MKRLLKIHAILLIIFPVFGFAQVSGTVEYVSDGDTFYLRMDTGDKITVRVADIDCPESTQEFGLVAKQFTTEAVQGKIVTLKVKELDPYDRTVAYVNYEGKDLSEELLKSGLAWHYTRYSDSPHFDELQLKARSAGLGLWSQEEPMAPWDYRRKQRN